jgi:hypothetical protein
MGMDVFGQDPTSEAGEYFRANVWGWVPLWSMCDDKFRTVASKVEYGYTNDGDGLGAEDAKALSRMINSSLENGVVQDWINQDNTAKDNLPNITCHCCDGAGIRSDERGINAGYPTKELDPDIAKIVGRTHGSCNACDGLGEKEPREASYRLHIEKVEEFAEFLADCGGFQIC